TGSRLASCKTADNRNTAVWKRYDIGGVYVARRRRNLGRKPSHKPRIGQPARIDRGEHLVEMCIDCFGVHGGNPVGSTVMRPIDDVAKWRSSPQRRKLQQFAKGLFVERLLALPPSVCDFAQKIVECW